LTFIVSEIGVNWDGNFDLAKEMMQKSKEVGCDAVKFQAFQKEIIKDHPEKDRLLKSAVSKENVNQINELAKSVGIEWFCTPMYPDAVDFLEPYVKKFKIRELDGRALLQNTVTPLVEKILNLNRETIISSQTPPTNSKYYDNPKIKWLYCVPKYPCSLEDINFKKLDEFDGYSNHYPDIIAPLSAAILGSKIIEIHITSDKTKNFVDNNVSFDYNQLKKLVELINDSEKIRH